MAPEAVARRMKAYLDHGAKFEAWQEDPFLALILYNQLREGFGWEPYKKVFAEYRALAPSQRPKNDDEKRDQWMVRFSRAVGKIWGRSSRPGACRPVKRQENPSRSFLSGCRRIGVGLEFSTPRPSPAARLPRSAVRPRIRFPALGHHSRRRSFHRAVPPVAGHLPVQFPSMTRRP